MVRDEWIECGEGKEEEEEEEEQEKIQTEGEMV